MFQDACEPLDVPFDEALRARCADLRPPSIVLNAPRRQKWRQRNPAAVARILPVIRPLMTKMGYDTDD